jgi:hypothetical protein
MFESMREVTGGSIMRGFIVCIIDKYIIRVIKSRRTVWVGHIARMGEMRNSLTILVGNPEGDHLGNPSVYRRIILKWVLMK